MLTVNIDSSGLLRLRAQLAGQSKQVAFATSRALNAAAYKAAQVTKQEMAQVFDRPIPWVLGSVRYTKATKEMLTATVDFDYWGKNSSVTPSHVLKSEIFGGRRALKRHEVALRRIGVLPDGMAIVPGAAAQMDAYGNMSAAQINQIMSWFKAFGVQGYRSNMRDGGKRLGRDKAGQRGFAYFVLKRRHGKLLPGVYQRFSFGAAGSAVKPVMIFVAIPAYRTALDFYGVAEKAAVAEFQRQYPAMLQDAMRTAR